MYVILLLVSATPPPVQASNSPDAPTDNDTSDSQCNVKVRRHHVIIPGCRNRNASYLTLALEIALIGMSTIAHINVLQCSTC